MLRRCVFAIVVLIAGIPLWSQGTSHSAAVTGSVTYRERVALPPDALVEVRLEDASRGNGGVRVLSEAEIPAKGRQVPISFELPYDSRSIDATHRYQVRASIRSKGQVIFASASAIPVITQGAPSTVNVMLNNVVPIAQGEQSATTSTTETAGSADLTLLFSRAWRVLDGPMKPALGSILVFLPNGTLLETSCQEPYRIATWSVDKQFPGTLRVVEDGSLAFTAKVVGLSQAGFELEQALAHGGERHRLRLAAVEKEFVCPDLPK